MAYITGTAATFADLQTALQNACTANGWTLSSGILSKNGCFFKLSNASNYLRIDGGTGRSGSTLTGSPAYGQMIGSITGYVVNFPINYEIHLFANPDEVYCIVNYNSDFYQQISFGKSDVPGIGGTGAWFSGAKQSDQTLTDATYGNKVFLSVEWPETVGVAGYNGYTSGLFLGGPEDNGSYNASFVHTGLDATPWRTGYGGSSALTGFRSAGTAVANLLQQLPNLYNSANVLLPIKPVALRSSGGVTIIANPKNARYLRIDNVVPGEIITFGAEQWKCYPFYRKDSTVRNGVAWLTGATHSGTFGYAIRYTGT